MQAMADVLINVPTERTNACDVSHSFVLLNLRPQWIWFRPEIAVNRLGNIIYDGSDWHGLALYCPTTHPQQWSMTFHSGADVTKMQTYLFERVQDTSTFLCTENEHTATFPGLLLPKIFCSV